MSDQSGRRPYALPPAEGEEGVPSVAGPRSGVAERYRVRRRLLVLGTGMAEVVRLAGGWLFDRVMAGWDVTVVVTPSTDPRPLHILGVRPVDLECVLSWHTPDRAPDTLAVDVDLYASDPRIRRMVQDFVALGESEIRLLGEHRPAEPEGAADGDAGSMPHHLSLAARAFKAQALAAVGAPAASSTDSFGITELFRSGALLPHSRGADNLSSIA